MIDFLTGNWQILVGIGVVIAIAAYSFYVFIKAPRNEQISKVQEWLLWAVAQAEKALGSGTGQLKLRYVYDMFIGRFPTLSKILTFSAFSLMVDNALAKFNSLLTANKKVEEYVQQIESGE